jgi:hypothetical protein
MRTMTDAKRILLTATALVAGFMPGLHALAQSRTMNEAVPLFQCPVTQDAGRIF